MYPRLRPHRKQRRTTRDLNFGFFWDRTMTDVFAMSNIWGGDALFRVTFVQFFQKNEDWSAIP
jgi:hypothetical protein